MNLKSTACLAALVCSLPAWGAELPFVGTKYLNPVGGMYSEQVLRIEADGKTTLRWSCPKHDDKPIYQGPFTNPLRVPFADGSMPDYDTHYLIRGNNVFVLDSEMNQRLTGDVIDGVETNIREWKVPFYGQAQGEKHPDVKQEGLSKFRRLCFGKD